MRKCKKNSRIRYDIVSYISFTTKNKYVNYFLVFLTRLTLRPLIILLKNFLESLALVTTFFASTHVPSIISPSSDHFVYFGLAWSWLKTPFNFVEFLEYSDSSSESTWGFFILFKFKIRNLSLLLWIDPFQKSLGLNYHPDQFFLNRLSCGKKIIMSMRIGK